MEERVRAEMTPPKTAKSLGCKSLLVVSQETGIPRRKLERWYSMYPETFEKLCSLVAKVGQRPHSQVK